MYCKLDLALISINIVSCTQLVCNFAFTFTLSQGFGFKTCQIETLKGQLETSQLTQVALAVHSPQLAAINDNLPLFTSLRNHRPRVSTITPSFDVKSVTVITTNRINVVRECNCLAGVATVTQEGVA